MQQTTERALHRRGRLPVLLAIGVLFLFALSACQVAVADDGTINIRPESTTTSSTGGGISQNSFTGLVTQAGDLDPNGATPIDPDQLYEWNGIVEWVDLEGGHFIIDRGCDNWALIPENDELYAKLREMNGERGTVWGTVNFDPNIYGRRAINASSVFAPGDIRPLIALPQIPCSDGPVVPGDHIVIQHSEVTLHGDLVWRGGALWLITPRGNVRLELPAIAFDRFPGLDAATGGEDSAASLTLGEFGVVGMWDLANTGLVVRVRDIEEWPHRTFVRDRCGGGVHHFVVGDEQMAAYGTLFIDNGTWKLRTKSGVVFVHPNAATDANTLIDPTSGDALSVAPHTFRGHEVVVIGDWKTDGRELHMEGDRFVRVKTVCEPPRPPFQPILPGEIAALGTLVFEDGRPYLDTPSGRIVLLTRRDVAGAEPEPADPSIFEDVLPGDVTGGAVIGEDGTVYPDSDMPDVVRPHRFVLVVGKWLLHREHLAIVVRYARPWPYPQTVDPVPVPEPMPVPPVLGYPMPIPGPMEVEPVMPGDYGVIEPDFGAGFSGGTDVDGYYEIPVTIIDPVPADAFTAIALR